MEQKLISVLFSKKLKELRRYAGMNQTDLANALNLSRATIIKYENSERIPDIETAYKISSYFNVSVDALIGVNECASPNPDIEYVYRKLGIEPDIAMMFSDLKDNDKNNLDSLNAMLSEWHQEELFKILFWTRKYTAFVAQEKINEKLYFLNFCKENGIEVKKEDENLNLIDLIEKYLKNKRIRYEWSECLNLNKKLSALQDESDSKAYCKYVIQNALLDLVEDVADDYICSRDLTNIDKLKIFWTEQCNSSKKDAEIK